MKVLQDVRKLTITGGTTYYLTIPQSMIKELGWRKGEKKTIRLVGEQIIIGDWSG
ncbi:MAG: AbrB/MazE/SpoVT family DNA-binding domain-containing protein [Candidatus Omnitrophica bacterium]|nr:AbrB/MazE/SpoVT family DNA-binding domain-containing protein [Candidatus Omnitrophota bacterium]